MKIDIFDKDGQKITRKEHRARYQEQLTASTYTRQEIISRGILTAQQLRRATLKKLLTPITYKSQLHYRKDELIKLLEK